MKICPHCNLNYSDHTLEFCLEDGAKLLWSRKLEVDAATVSSPARPNSSIAETVQLPEAKFPANLNFKYLEKDTIEQKSSPLTIKTDLLDAQNDLQKNKILEISPIILALAHNWWQWVYLNTQNYYAFSTYVFSANFLMWLLLLSAGIIVGLLALKHCRNKNFAYTSLIILSINLLLILVPRR